MNWNGGKWLEWMFKKSQKLEPQRRGGAEKKSACTSLRAKRGNPLQKKQSLKEIATLRSQ